MVSFRLERMKHEGDEGTWEHALQDVYTAAPGLVCRILAPHGVVVK